jgi:hypothetical protein
MHDAPPLSEYLRKCMDRYNTRCLTPISQYSEGKHGVHSNLFFNSIKSQIFLVSNERLLHQLSMSASEIEMN